MIRVLHISDTHGSFPKLNGNFDIIIHSGDIFPGYSVAHQAKWLSDSMEKFKEWIDEAPFLFILGNHDFISAEYVEMEMVANGIRAINLNNKLVDFEGNKFYGFPYVPFINGEWSNERFVPDMKVEVEKAVLNFPKEGDWTLVSHAPIYGVLDELNNGEKIGNVQLLNSLDEEVDNHPSRIMCGHIHESHGIMIHNNILISNAAMTQHIMCF